MNGNILTNKSATDRSATDFYPTPENVTIALMEYLDLPKDTVIWEPACGEGHISAVLLKMGYDVMSSDLYDRGYGHTGIDYLKNDIYNYDWAITNPPFSQAEEFIRQSIKRGRPFAMLLKSQYWHSAKRRKLFEQHRPKAVLPLTWRPDFLFGQKGGSPTMDCIWTVWDINPADCTIYYPLSKFKAEV